MARIPDGTLRDWNDGETVTSFDYEQALEILRIAINSTDDDVVILKNAASGAIKRVPSGAVFPTSPSPAIGDIFFRTDLGVLYVLDSGSQWKAFSPKQLVDDHIAANDPHQSYANALTWAKSFGLGGPAAVANIDWNTITASGFYASQTNSPEPGGTFFGFHAQFSTTHATQFAQRSGKAYTRNKENGTWESWVLLATTVQNPWNDLTLQNGWTNFGNGYANAGYRLDNNKRVELRGVPRAGTITDGTVIATLPASYRPTSAKMYTVNAGGSGVCRVVIETNGNITIYSGKNDILSLDDIPPIPTA